MEPEALVRGVQQISDPKTTNVKKDAAQNEIQYGKMDGKTVPFLTYLVRYPDSRNTSGKGETISTSFRTV